MKTSSSVLSCCHCESSPSVPYVAEGAYQLLKCGGCGLVHLDRVHADSHDFLADVTAQETPGALEYWGYPEFFLKHQEIFTRFFEERFLRIRAERPPEGKWLDVGSGYGLWQNYLSQKDIPNFGIEIEAEAFTHARGMGVNLSHTSIENFMTTERYAVITMCDVLEHVPDPNLVLRKCYELLLPGGFLYIQVPDVMGLRYPYKDSLGLPHHLWQFNSHVLTGLCQKNHFTVQMHWTGVQGVIRHYENGGPTFLTKTLWTLARATRRGNRLQLLVKK